MSVLVPMLVSFLIESPTNSTTTGSRSLHEQALQKLIKLGPQYPSHFRTVMHNMPQIKSRLEAAVKHQQEASKAASSKAAAQSKVANAQAQPSQPSIKLKMDFSNFGSVS